MRSCRLPLAARLVRRSVVPSQAADRVKVGFISTLSGPSAALGVDIRDAFMLAVKLNGGKLGGSRRGADRRRPVQARRGAAARRKT